MTATEALRILDANDAAIAANVDAYMAGQIDYEEFGRRQVAAHDAITRAGQGDAWRRRQFRRSPMHRVGGR